MSSPSQAEFPAFAPRAPWFGPDLQTLRNIMRGPSLAEAREQTASGEAIRFDVSDGTGDQLVARFFEPLASVPMRAERSAPLVVLVHGLGGSDESAYIQVSTAHLRVRGYRVLQLNLRGAGPSRPLCAESYHAGRTEDFRDVMAGLPEAWAGDGVVAVGFSLGGNMLLKYAAEFGGLRAVVSVSAPIDLAAASNRILQPRNWPYHRHVLNSLKRQALAAVPAPGEEESRLIRSVRSIFEFDERIVAPRNGFEGAADYYARNNARRFLPDIEIPALVIHALDDPWIPSRSYTDFPWSRHPRLVPLLAGGGGHVGFHAAGSRVPWHDRCIERFLAALDG